MYKFSEKKLVRWIVCGPGKIYGAEHLIQIFGAGCVVPRGPPRTEKEEFVVGRSVGSLDSNKKRYLGTFCVFEPSSKASHQEMEESLL